MIILVVNTGSSSLRFQLIQKNGWKIVKQGYIDRIKNHEQALKNVLVRLPIKNVCAIGHRIVHGGNIFTKTTKITPAVLKKIEKLTPLAPLHNPPGLAGIRAAQKFLPHIPNYAVFDTAFHQTMPEKAYAYALPRNLIKKYDIRRYGFHGTSHKYVSHEAIRLLNKKNSRIVTCHLGNGSSITAILNGYSVDTSMGFTPLEGIPMGTRSGDIDPAIIPFLQKHEKMSAKKIDTMLNYESGLLGLCGKWDMRDIWARAKKGDRSCLTALGLYCYKIAKYIGSYAAVLNGLDAVVFTGAIGENAWYVRNDVCSYLAHLGILINQEKNRKNDVEINTPKSAIKVFVIPTNEGEEIAKEVFLLYNT